MSYEGTAVELRTSAGCGGEIMGWRDAKKPADKSATPAEKSSSGNKPREKARRPSWRDPLEQAPVEAGTVRRGWWKSQRSDHGRQMGYRTKLAIWTLVFAAMVAAFVWALGEFESKAQLVALCVTEYNRDFFPPNAWAAEDLQRFGEQFDERNGDANVLATTGDWNARSREDALKQLRQAIAKIKPGGPATRGVILKEGGTVLIYLSAHGVVDSEGRPCLLLARSHPWDESSWLPVSDVLAEISRHHQGEKKLLALDCNRMLANWSCGLLYNSLADRLDEIVRKHNEQDPNLVVLNSTSSGELGRAAPELGGSAFGYCFFQGLRGAADLDNGKVELIELKAYLDREIQNWTVGQRFGHQQTLLAPSDAKDFPLTYCEEGPGNYEPDEKDRLTTAAESWNLSNTDWNKIEKLWKEHDRLREAKVYRYDPRRWGQLEGDLLRLEQLMLAGSAYHDSRIEAIRRAEGTVGKFKDFPWIVSPCNLPLTERQHNVADIVADQASTADVEQPDGEETPPKPYHVAAKDIWNRLRSGAIDTKAITEALDKFEKSRHTDNPPFDVVELAFLRMLRQHVDAEAPSLASALEARHLAESAATPPDERALYWIAGQVAEADKARRQAEDRLFVGGSSFPEENVWREVKSRYEQAMQTADQVGDAFDLRDRGLAEAPYLVEWLWLERIAPSGLEEHVPRDSNKQWTDLKENFVRPLRELAVELDNSASRVANGGDGGGADDWKQPSETVSTMRRSLDETLAKYDEALTRGQARHQERAAVAERLLALPILAAGRRASWRRIQHETLQQNLAQAIDQVAGTRSRRMKDVPTKAQQLSSDTPNVIDPSDAAQHPILTLLDDIAQADEKPQMPRSDASKPSQRDLLDMLAAQGGIIRNRLKQANQKLAAGAPAAADEEPGDIRGRHSQADRALRAVAAIWRPDEQHDPTAGLFRFDLHQLMLWQCGRFMEDFWGPSQNPYFQIVASDCLEKAEGLDDQDQADHLRQRCRRRLARLEAVAEKPVTVGAEPLAISASADQPWTELKLRADVAPNVPEGTAAAYLRQDAREPQDAIARLSTDSTGSTTGKRIEVAIAGAENVSHPQLPAVFVTPRLNWLPTGAGAGALAPKTVAFYRGHEFSLPLNVSEKGVPIEYTPDEPVPPTVVVRGDEMVPISIMFVFDCSVSMNAADVRLGGIERTRFEAARTVLLETLKRLEELNRQPGHHIQVGLCLYGHRVFYKPHPTRRDPITGRPPLIPADREIEPTGFETMMSDFATSRGIRLFYPGLDVEVHLPVRLFTANQYELVENCFTDHDSVRDGKREALRGLAPWGMTPLYRAIDKASADLNARAGDSRKRIIAITDGFNQPDEPQRLPPQEKQILEAEMMTLFGAHRDMQLDVVGIGDQLRTDTNQLNQLKRITEKATGEVFLTTDATEFFQQLKNWLSLGEFEVVGAGTRFRANLDQRLEITPTPKQKTDYTVGVIGVEQRAEAPISLEGGEALELYLEEGELEYRPYTRDDPRTLQPVSTPSGAGHETFEVRSHSPEAPDAPGWAEFRVSIQNSDLRRFTPRPVEAWVDITPIRDLDGAGATTYHFCDLNFMPDKPVPLLTCRAPKFPKSECGNARIELWFKMNRTDSSSTTTEPVRKLRDWLRIERAGVQVRAEKSAGGVVVDETPLVGAPETYQPGRVKIEMYSPATGKPADRAIHDYSGRRHLFLFPRGTNLDECLVKVTPREALEKDAYHYRLDKQPLPSR